MKTPLKKIYQATVKKLYILIFFGMIGLVPKPASSQICDSITPVFTVDLTSSPMATWTSPPGKRDGLCCGANSPDVCVEFIITLDPGANGIKFDIASGAVPPGALFYQINCGPIVRVGDPVCLNGVGPHILTFCKPGNNTNSYQITSYPKPSLNGTQYVSQACSGEMSVVGLMDTGITWTSVPYDAIENGYLSCTANCDTVTVTHPGGSAPAVVNYQVCGYILGGCNPVYFCDTLTVHFVNDLAVNITPQNPTICFGGTPATVTATGTGGLAPFSYVWSTGATTQSISVTAGTYTVQLTDAMGCSIARDTVVVNALPSPIAANAGPDLLLCNGAQSTVQLSGSFVASTGAIWTNASGIFSPNNATMNAIYTPSAGEIAAGVANLSLITTGNSGCPADTDAIRINIGTQPAPSISGPSPVCAYSSATYSTTTQPNVNYNWNVTGGTITGVTASSINVRWNAGPTGTITLTATHTSSCDSVVTTNITIHPTPIPVINGPAASCVYTTNTYNLQTATSNTILWTVSGGQIIGANNATGVNILWNTPGTGTVTVTETTSFGCDSAVAISVNVGQTSIPQINGPATVCAYSSSSYSTPVTANTSYTWSVTGGTITTNTGTAVSIRWNAGPSGVITLQATNASGCDSTVTRNITINPTPVPVIAGPGTLCQYSTATYSLTTVSGNSVSWSVSGGQITGSTTANTINVLWNTAGTGSVTITEANSFGCDSTVSIAVNVGQTPVPQINGVTTVCAYSTTAYSTPTTAGTTYAWSVTGGTITLNSGSSISVLWSSAASGTITLTATNSASGCDSTIASNVVIHPTPTPVLVGPSTACTQTTEVYYLQTSSSNAIVWSVTGGQIVGANNTNSISVFWNTPGIGTVSVTETHALGCDSTVAMLVTVGQTSVPQINGVAAVCAYSTTSYSTPLVANTTYSWIVTGGAITSNSGSSISVLWSAAASGTITLTATNVSGCDSTVTSNVIINPTPAPAIVGPSTACTQTTGVYYLQTATSNLIAWSVTGGQIIGASNTNSITVLWNTPGTGSVSVTETHPLGCDSSVAVSVSVGQSSIPQINGVGTVCAYSTSSYYTPFTSNTTYTWSVTGGTITSNSGTSVLIQWNAVPSGLITLTATNASGCDSTVTKNITINPTPTPVITGVASTCTHSTTSYSLQTFSANTISWSVSGGTIVGANNTNRIAILWTSPGTNLITVTETNSLGCDSTVTFPVNVGFTAIPQINGPNTVCAYSSSSYYTSVWSNTTYTWNVNGGTITSNTGPAITVVWNAVPTGTISLTASNISGCDSTISTSITIHPTPVPVILGASANCTQTTDVYQVANPTANTFLWTVNGGTIIGSANLNYVTVNWTTPGIGRVAVTETNSLGCDSTAVMNVRLNARPWPVLSGNPQVCEMDTATYSVPYVAGHNYLWNVVGGGIVGFTVSNSIDVQWYTPGTGSVSCRQVSPDGCDSLVDMNVLINGRPSPYITGPATACQNLNYSYSVNPTAGNVYNWTVTGGIILNGTSSPQVDVKWDNTGAGDITLVESTANGCAAMTNTSVQIFSRPAPAITGSNVACISPLMTNYSVMNEPGVYYLWTVSGGSIMSGNGTSSIDILWNTPGSHQVTVAAIDLATGCDSVMNKSVSVDSLAQVSVSALSFVGCAPMHINFTGNQPDPSYHYQWRFGDGGSAAAANPTHFYTVPGTYPVYVYATNATGCRDSAQATVTVNPSPTAAFTQQSTTEVYYAGMSTLTLSNNSTGAVQYQWDFGNGDNSTDFEPQYQYTSPGLYRITLVSTNAYGCSDTSNSILDVRVPEDLYVPNAFTPNGDAINDYFSIAERNITDLRVIIYNRWGEQVFKSDQVNFAWDGTYRGQPVKQDVYVYLIKASGFHGKGYDLKGTVTVVR